MILRETPEHWRAEVEKHAARGVYKQLSLPMAARLWPTPVTYDANPGGPGNHYQGLGWMGKHGSWPTPTASEGANRNRKRCPSHSKGGGHGKVLAGEVGGSLNPAWVEQLMGFPPGWTELAGPPAPASPSTPGKPHAPQSAR